ncbi:MAG: uroporphyrinogen-III synthase [Sphingobium sp.]|nr:uroporphyrinogen-III synthase [Sphingobium sp.]
MIPLLLLRPQPGNDASAARARAMGLEVVQLPLFEVVAIEGDPVPVAPFDCLLVTSANGARFGGDALAAYGDLPLYAVGEATARALRESGHRHVVTGGGDAASTAPMIAADGHSYVLHVCGADVRPFDSHGLQIVRHVVYRSAERDATAVRPVLDALGPAVAAVHSPRAGERLRALLTDAQRAQIHIAAISAATAQACGSGWASLAVSAAPDDTALLGCAEALCIRAG